MIYGISKKYASRGKWEVYVVAFAAEAEAQEWLHTEERDFREREIISRDEALEWVGEDELWAAEQMA